MTAEEGTAGESLYSFSCDTSAADATKVLLSVSDADQQTTKQGNLEAFLEALDRTVPEQNDKQEHKTAKRSGQLIDIDCDYVFTHFEDSEKYIQRYRYYHTSGDTGKYSLDARSLGIDVSGASVDGTSTSGRSVTSVYSYTRNFSSRRSVSEMSTSSIKRYKSAPCSQNQKSAKRVYLTWDQYVALCDAPSQSNQSNTHTGSHLVSEEGEQMSAPAARTINVSSARPLRKPCIDICSISSKNNDSSAHHKETMKEIEQTVGKLAVGNPPLMGCAKSETNLCKSQGKCSRPILNKPNAYSESSISAIETKSLLRIPCTEGTPTLVKEKTQKVTSLPASSLEQCINGEKVKLRGPSAKKVVAYKCRNTRVSTVYKVTKIRRKQIHV